MVQFLSDLRSVLGSSALTRVARKVLENDCLALAGQLAYFFVLFLFHFIMFLVALVSSVVDDPEPALKALAGSLEEFLPREAIRLLTDYLDRTLQGISSLTLLFAALLTLGTGSAASEAIIKAANRSYGVLETRSFWRIRAISILLILGFTVLIGTLSFVIFSLEAEGYLSRRGISSPREGRRPYLGRGLFRGLEPLAWRLHAEFARGLTSGTTTGTRRHPDFLIISLGSHASSMTSLECRTVVIGLPSQNMTRP